MKQSAWITVFTERQVNKLFHGTTFPIKMTYSVELSKIHHVFFIICHCLDWQSAGLLLRVTAPFDGDSNGNGDGDGHGDGGVDGDGEGSDNGKGDGGGDGNGDGDGESP